MNPWTILGWWVLVVVIAVSLPVVKSLVVTIVAVFDAYGRHMKTRNIPPAEGQRWSSLGNRAILITRITETGRVCINIGNAGWSDSPEEWKRRVRSRHLYLYHDGQSTVES